MLKAYRLTRPARADIEKIWDHTVAQWSVEQAHIYLRGLEKTLNLLLSQPYLARERTEISPPVRLHAYGQHLIIYRIEGEFIDVIRIVHARQHWAVLLRE